MADDPTVIPRSSLPAGCLLTLGSTSLTCLLLLVNGSLVMAVLNSIPATAPTWTRKPEFVQFLLFLVPVLLVVIEWLMIDFVRGRLFRRPRE